MLASTIQEMCGFLASQVGHFSGESSFTYSIISAEEFNDPNFKVIEDISAKKWDCNKEAEKLLNEGFSREHLSKTLTTKTRKDTEYFLVSTITFSSSPKVSGEINLLCKFVGGILRKNLLITNFCLDYIGDSYLICEESRSWRNGMKIITNIIKEYEKDPKKFLLNRMN